jgi:hypothetical protein
MKITLYTVLTCDSGGCGRYPTNQYFLTEKEAKAYCDKHFQNWGWTSTEDATVEDGVYKRTHHRGQIYLAKSEAENKALIKKIKSLLTPEEIRFIKDNM